MSCPFRWPRGHGSAVPLHWRGTGLLLLLGLLLLRRAPTLEGMYYPQAQNYAIGLCPLA